MQCLCLCSSLIFFFFAVVLAMPITVFIFVLSGGDESNSVVQRGNINGNAEQQGVTLEQLEPFTSVVLHELISLVHNTLNSSGQNQVKESHLEALDVTVENNCTHARTENSVLLEDNPVTSIFWTIEPLVLRKVFLVMVVGLPIYFICLSNDLNLLHIFGDLCNIPTLYYFANLEN